jgi:hypothetical protein
MILFSKNINEVPKEDGSYGDGIIFSIAVSIDEWEVIKTLGVLNIPVELLENNDEV